MKVRSWYGLNGEIEVENELWHLVKLGNIALNHPPVVNLILRRGMPNADRLRLSYLHEFGHFQTLPFSILHILFLLTRAPLIERSLPHWLIWLAALALAHESVWELAAETYVVANDSKEYLAAYRKTPNLLMPAFWAAKVCLGMGLSWWLLREKD